MIDDCAPAPVIRLQIVSETTKAESNRLHALLSVEDTMRDDVFAPLSSTLVQDVSRVAGPDGHIEMMALPRLREAVNVQVQRTMLGKPDRDGSLAPYRVANGQVQPHSPYFRVLWNRMMIAALGAVEAQAVIMRKYLPADIERMFAFGTLNPFHTDTAEMDEPGQYDPLRQWADGVELSDRIWKSAGEMRRKLDAYLTEAIATGKPLQQIARDLEAYLVPGRADIRTKDGQNASFDAMRLARTEVAAAYHRASWLAAQQNPFVETYSPFVAPGHKCCDECDLQQAGGPYPKSDGSHMPPFHSHCACGVRWNEIPEPEGVAERMQAYIQQAISQERRSLVDFISPLMSNRFVKMLFGGRK